MIIDTETNKIETDPITAIEDACCSAIDHCQIRLDDLTDELDSLADMHRQIAAYYDLMVSCKVCRKFYTNAHLTDNCSIAAWEMYLNKLKQIEADFFSYHNLNPLGIFKQL